MKRDTASLAPQNRSVEAVVAENEHLRKWIRVEGVRTNTCTYDALGEICEGCRCKRYYASRGYGCKIIDDRKGAMEEK